jgi:hypothetical protein
MPVNTRAVTRSQAVVGTSDSSQPAGARSRQRKTAVTVTIGEPSASVLAIMTEILRNVVEQVRQITTKGGEIEMNSDHDDENGEDEEDQESGDDIFSSFDSESEFVEWNNKIPNNLRSPLKEGKKLGTLKIT